VIIHDDVKKIVAFTRADGIMSAEGILDNPALFLPRIGSREEAHIGITINDPSPLLKCDKSGRENYENGCARLKSKRPKSSLKVRTASTRKNEKRFPT
jgi:tRNA-dihydrouridine synthase